MVTYAVVIIMMMRIMGKEARLQRRGRVAVVAGHKVRGLCGQRRGGLVLGRRFAGGLERCRRHCGGGPLVRWRQLLLLGGLEQRGLAQGEGLGGGIEGRRGVVLRGTGVCGWEGGIVVVVIVARHRGGKAWRALVSDGKREASRVGR